MQSAEWGVPQYIAVFTIFNDVLCLGGNVLLVDPILLFTILFEHLIFGQNITLTKILPCGTFYNFIIFILL